MGVAGTAGVGPPSAPEGKRRRRATGITKKRPKHRKSRVKMENNIGFSVGNTYCKISFNCKNCHSAAVADGASGLAEMSWGRGSTWVATAKSSRSFLFRDVTIALSGVSTMKIIPDESENSALFFDAQLTCTRCALIEAAAINRRARPQSWHLLSQHPFASETDVAGRQSGVVRDGKWRKWRWKAWLLARC